MDSARHVFERIVNPRFSSYMTSYDGASLMDSARHFIKRIVNPRLLSE